MQTAYIAKEQEVIAILYNLKHEVDPALPAGQWYVLSPAMSDFNVDFLNQHIGEYAGAR